MICLPLKGCLTLSLVRSILAMLIALALAAAPLASAWAVMPAKSMASEGTAGAHGAVMDCAKMGMAVATGDTDFDCPCCDTKSKCPDMAACLIKCSVQVIGIMMPAIKLAAVDGRPLRPSELQEPPDWSLRPPAPPPRT